MSRDDKQQSNIQQHIVRVVAGLIIIKYSFKASPKDDIVDGISDTRQDYTFTKHIKELLQFNHY